MADRPIGAGGPSREVGIGRPRMLPLSGKRPKMRRLTSDSARAHPDRPAQPALDPRQSVPTGPSGASVRADARDRNGIGTPMRVDEDVWYGPGYLELTDSRGE